MTLLSPVGTQPPLSYSQIIEECLNTVPISTTSDLELVITTLGQVLTQDPNPPKHAAFYKRLSERVMELKGTSLALPSASPATAFITSPAMPTSSPETTFSMSSAMHSSSPAIFSAAGSMETLAYAVQSRLDAFRFMGSLEKVAYVYGKMQKRVESHREPLPPALTRKRGYEKAIGVLQQQEERLAKQSKIEWLLTDLIPEAGLAEVTPPFRVLLLTNQAKLRVLISRYGVTFNQIKVIPFSPLETLLQATDCTLFEAPEASHEAASAAARPTDLLKGEKCAFGVLLKLGAPLDQIFEMTCFDSSAATLLQQLLSSTTPEARRLLRALRYTLTYNLHEKPSFGASRPKTIHRWFSEAANFCEPLPEDHVVASGVADALKKITRMEDRRTVVVLAADFHVLMGAGLDLVSLANSPSTGNMRNLLFSGSTSVRVLIEHYGVTVPQINDMPPQLLKMLLEADRTKVFTSVNATWKEEISPLGMLLKLGLSITQICELTAADPKGLSPAKYLSCLLGNAKLVSAIDCSLTYNLHEKPDFTTTNSKDVHAWLFGNVYPFYKKLPEGHIIDIPPEEIKRVTVLEDRRALIKHAKAFAELRAAGIDIVDVVNDPSPAPSPFTLAIGRPLEWFSTIAYILRSGNIKWPEIKALPSELKRLVLGNSMSVVALANVGITIADLINIAPDEAPIQVPASFMSGAGFAYPTQEFIIRYGTKLHPLLSIMNFAEIVALARDRSTRLYITRSYEIMQLVRAGIPLGTLKALTDEQRDTVVFNHTAIIKLLSSGLSFETILTKTEQEIRDSLLDDEFELSDSDGALIVGDDLDT